MIAPHIVVEVVCGARSRPLSRRVEIKNYTAIGRQLQTRSPVISLELAPAVC